MAWIGGLAEWTEGDTAFFSVAFTWLLDSVYPRAVYYRSLGMKVCVGGPATFLKRPTKGLEKIAEIGGHYPDAVAKHNPLATMASRGCSEVCSHCIVPKMEGGFSFYPKFPVRPILCDNNLSGLPPAYQNFIIRRYRETNTPLIDANSGFEPRTFTPEVYERWKPLINEGGGPWRFGYDDMADREFVLPVMRMLANEPARRKRVYVLIGNEPYAECMQRIQEVLDHGCEPHVQPYISLTQTKRTRTGRPIPRANYDWNEVLLIDVARWANACHCRFPFSKYKRSRKNVLRYDAQQGLYA